MQRRIVGGGAGVVVIVSPEAAATEMRSGSNLASDVKEESCRRMKSIMRTSAQKAAAETAMMTISGVCAPVAIRHDLQVW